jgi:hypothetical protein
MFLRVEDKKKCALKAIREQKIAPSQPVFCFTKARKSAQVVFSQLLVVKKGVLCYNCCLWPSIVTRCFKTLIANNSLFCCHTRERKTINTKISAFDKCTRVLLHTTPSVSRATQTTFFFQFPAREKQKEAISHQLSDVRSMRRRRRRKKVKRRALINRRQYQMCHSSMLLINHPSLQQAALFFKGSAPHWILPLSSSH